MASTREGRRREILEVAGELFGTRGYDAATLRDIARRTGLPRGSLHHHFDSKESILFEIVATTYSAFERNLELVATIDGTAIERIWSYVYANVLGNATNVPLASVLSQELRLLRPAYREVVSVMRRAHEEAFVRLLEEGQHARVVRIELNARLTMVAVLTMCNSVHIWYRPDSSSTPEVIAANYADFVFAAVGSDDVLDGREPIDRRSLAEVFTPPVEVFTSDTVPVAETASGTSRAVL